MRLARLYSVCVLSSDFDSVTYKPSSCQMPPGAHRLRSEGPCMVRERPFVVNVCMACSFPAPTSHPRRELHGTRRPQARPRRSWRGCPPCSQAARAGCGMKVADWLTLIWEIMQDYVMCPRYHRVLGSGGRGQERGQPWRGERAGPVLAGRGGGGQAVSQDAVPLEAGEGREAGSLLHPPEGTSPGNTLL